MAVKIYLYVSLPPMKMDTEKENGMDQQWEDFDSDPWILVVSM